MRIRGTLYGSLLYERPEHAAVRKELAAFVARPGPLAVEIGFDHGITVLDRARAFPEWKQLGVEIRERRVGAARPHAPANCLLLRMDGRALVGSLLPDDSIHALYLLFPTPHADARRHLVSPAFAEAVRRVLRPAAPLWFATDRVDLAEAFDACFPWSAAAPPPLGAELSRRERVCRRDGLAVYRRCVARPDTAPP